MSTQFQEVLTELRRFERELGGVRNFRGLPFIERKVRAHEFRQSYTDFEYIYLTVLGLGQLQLHCEEIVRKNNGRKFTQNPGVRLLEQRTGITMHAEREGANHLLRSAPSALLAAFALARRLEGDATCAFFLEAFDRSADPCLEGRTARLLEYLSSGGKAVAETTPPTEDLALDVLRPDARPEDIVGEHLRVFVNECTWLWALSRGVPYDEAKRARQQATAANFERFCNAATLEAAMLARGVAEDVEVKQWEVHVDGGRWAPYSWEQNVAIERARHLRMRLCQVKVHPWIYEIDFERQVQRNPVTDKERPVRAVSAPLVSARGGGGGQGRMTHEQLKAAIARFVEMETLAAAPKANLDEAAQGNPTLGAVEDSQSSLE